MCNILDSRMQPPPKHLHLAARHPLLVFFGCFVGMPLAVFGSVLAVVGMLGLPLGWLAA